MILFPTLLYEVNQELELIVNDFPDFCNLPPYTIGTKCIVEEIHAYGYNIRFFDGELFRIMNSELPLYFVKTKKQLPLKQRIATISRILKNQFITLFNSKPTIMLKIDVLCDNGIFAKSGTIYYYETNSYKDKTYYALYDPKTHEKFMSMNQPEFNKYCSVCN